MYCAAHGEAVWLAQAAAGRLIACFLSATLRASVRLCINAGSWESFLPSQDCHNSCHKHPSRIASYQSINRYSLGTCWARRLAGKQADVKIASWVGQPLSLVWGRPSPSSHEQFRGCFWPDREEHTHMLATGQDEVRAVEVFRRKRASKSGSDQSPLDAASLHSQGCC